jgi:SAM-dependent methyltransferase
MQETQGIEARLAAAPDLGFRARVLHEYRIVAEATRSRMALDTARILDFGCGEGIAAASFALRLPNATVFGVDILPPNVKRLRQKLQQQVGVEVPSNLFLAGSEPGTLPDEMAGIDLIFAWSVFEHVSFAQLVETMRLLRQRLTPTGLFFLQISPLYFSPKGAHLYRFDSSPWTHLLHEVDALKGMVTNSDAPERMKVHEWKQFEGLNRATADDIVATARDAGFAIVSEERLRVAHEPPARLIRAYNRDALVTEEIRLLLRPRPDA